jgi:hypothetical protein
MIILDCEASGLHPDSYPVEVAWYDFETGEQDSFLIKPADHWNYWDTNAEEIHGLNQGQLVTDGLSVFHATMRLRKALADKAVYSDAPGYDDFWLQVLFEACDEDVPFPVKSVYDLVNQDQLGQLSTLLMFAKRPHRALDDCKVIAGVVQEAMAFTV